MYADDLIFFSKAKMGEIKALEQCVKTYYSWSSQLINKDKSGIIASKTVHPIFLKQITQHLGMRKLERDVKYLGAPLFPSTKRSENFNYLVQQVDRRLTGWKMKTLSWAGRNILIKSVVQAVPTFSMSAFDVPKQTSIISTNR